MRSRVAVLLAALAASLVLSDTAGARIVVQKGIAGLELQMTKPQVRAVLGKPTRIRTGTNDFGPYTQFVYPRVTATFQGGPRVTGLRTTSRRERTGRGIGVGSTEAQVRARVAGVHCESVGTFRHCFVGRFLPGRKITDFHFRRGRVSAVVIGFVLD